MQGKSWCLCQTKPGQDPRSAPRRPGSGQSSPANGMFPADSRLLDRICHPSSDPPNSLVLGLCDPLPRPSLVLACHRLQLLASHRLRNPRRRRLQLEPVLVLGLPRPLASFPGALQLLRLDHPPPFPADHLRMPRLNPPLPRVLRDPQAPRAISSSGLLLSLNLPLPLPPQRAHEHLPPPATHMPLRGPFPLFDKCHPLFKISVAAKGMSDRDRPAHSPPSSHRLYLP